MKNEFGGRIAQVGHLMDAGDRDHIADVIAKVSDSLGPIQILVNNAAINVVGSIFDYDPENWDWCLRVNLLGPWYLCRRILPIMRDVGGGVVVNVSTYAPDVGGGGVEAPYAITKGGLNTLTRCVAYEGGPQNIRAITVSMGMVKGTRFADQHPELFEMPESQGVLEGYPDAADIAESVAFLASDKASQVTGETLNVAGGAYMRN